MSVSLATVILCFQPVLSSRIGGAELLLDSTVCAEMNLPSIGACKKQL